jgi:hypothetical protein
MVAAVYLVSFDPALGAEIRKTRPAWWTGL